MGPESLTKSRRLEIVRHGVSDDLVVLWDPPNGVGMELEERIDSGAIIWVNLPPTVERAFLQKLERPCGPSRK